MVSYRLEYPSKGGDFARLGARGMEQGKTQVSSALSYIVRWLIIGPSDKNNALIQPDYHSLLHQLGRFEEPGAPPPLQILSSFFATLSKSDDPKSKLVLSTAPASFNVLFNPQDLTYKTENWVDVWANMLKLLSGDSLQEYEVQLASLVDLVVAGIQRSQASSTNPKKVS